MRALVLGLAGALCVGGAAHAGEVTFGYDFYSKGAPQLSGVPIGKSLYRMALDVNGVGAEIEAVQTGRAGLVSDRLTGHIGHTFNVGPVALTPAVVAGYARGLNDDYGIIGGQLVARYQVLPRIAVRASGRAWHSFARNAAPLNHADLDHAPVKEVQVSVGPEFSVNEHFVVGVSAGRDFGSLPGAHVGPYISVRF